MKNFFSILSLLSLCITAISQNPLFEFGEVRPISYDGKSSDSYEKITWYNVNTTPETWSVQDSILVCTGLPIGVVRSHRVFENYILRVDWKHMEAGGNSGMFMWSKAEPGQNRLPDGVEVQMLELDWVNLNTRDGKKPPVAYVQGELFGVGGVETLPDNPRGSRSKSVEHRCKPKGEWNTYEVVCVDGTIKLSINGKFVNGIAQSSQRKGFMCLESEGAEIHFKNLRVIELPKGNTLK